MSKQISLLKISLILQKMKVNLKSHKRLFNRKPFNWEKKVCVSSSLFKEIGIIMKLTCLLVLVIIVLGS